VGFTVQDFFGKTIRAFVSACLLMVLCAGCSLITSTYRGSDSETFEKIERSYQLGQYQRSLDQCAALIAQHPGGAFYDRALFYAGLSLVQLGPAAENYSRALQYFRKLIQECPQSALRHESTAWVNILSRSAQAQKELQEREVLISQCRSASDEKDRRIARLAAENERLKKELELFKKADLQFQQQKKDMQNAGKP
jgi:tetratricopeptide (TPR) repeat protein